VLKRERKREKKVPKVEALLVVMLIVVEYPRVFFERDEMDMVCRI
jgi:hypothetical protein